MNHFIQTKICLDCMVIGKSLHKPTNIKTTSNRYIKQTYSNYDRMKKIKAQKCANLSIHYCWHFMFYLQ